MDSELANILSRRKNINEGNKVTPRFAKVSVYSEFHEFSRQQIKDYENDFKKYNVSNSGAIDLGELKTMMEKLGSPQTFLALKAMIKEVDEDGQISFREFLNVFRKARAGTLEADSGFGQLEKVMDIKVEDVGVKQAKHFFEAKIADVSRKGKFEEELIAEREDVIVKEEEKKKKLERFRSTAALFMGSRMQIR